MTVRLGIAGWIAVVTSPVVFAQASKTSSPPGSGGHAQATSRRSVEQPRQAWRAALTANREQVGIGVFWMRAQYDLLFGRPQSLNVLEVAAPNASGTPSIEIVQADGRELTSDLGRDDRALAAINGGFFAPDGAPVGYLKDDGVFVHERTEGRPGGLVVDRSGRAWIRDLPVSDSAAFYEALGCGPMLVRAGRVIERGARSRGILHPRTGVGWRQDQSLVFVVADGRTEFAGGMSLEEFGSIFSELGCTTALNLDGGGSSTLWIRGCDGDGVVNFPSDNSVFDHGGERTVGNAVLVRAPAVVVVDDPDAEISGIGRRKSDKGYGAGARVFANGAAVRATWSTQLTHGITSWAVSGWWPAESGFGEAGEPRAKITIGEWTAEFDQSVAEAGRWIPLGTIRAADGAIVIRVEGCADRAVIVDAFRLVEV